LHVLMPDYQGRLVTVTRGGQVQLLTDREI